MRQLPKIDYSHFTIPLVKDPTEIHVLSVSSDKCSPVKSRGGMKDYLIRTWLFTRPLLEEAARILNLRRNGSRHELEEIEGEIIPGDKECYIWNVFKNKSYERWKIIGGIKVMRVWCPVTSEAVVKDVVKGGNKKEKLGGWNIRN
jgi:hypothetical protein